ncbi:dihydrofolate reductase family protein [Beijerinckia sp. L45]|uniref:dihydrofolate reductase family protein n=1 Tax=Beijerinckia sp. L45 TaxID=1641855 RepID=UPI00131E66D6|nr:RibD family protein [Beijerinckia sp. L45]
MPKPHVICHMTSSVDGRIKIKRWSTVDVEGHVEKAYEEIHDKLEGDAWICGRITMQGYAMGEAPPAYDGPAIPRTDFVARRAERYAIGLDAHGKMNWGTRNDITGDHVVMVLTESVSDAHLDALRRAGVSYIFGGRDAIDVARVLGILGTTFGIKRLLVEGGGRINGSFLKAGAIDEISLLLAPAVDGLVGTPTVFDYTGEPDDATAKRLAVKLVSTEVLDGGIVWLRHTVAMAV